MFNSSLRRAAAAAAAAGSVAGAGAIFTAHAAPSSVLDSLVSVDKRLQALEGAPGQGGASMARPRPTTSVAAVGGSLPVSAEEFARRAYCAVANPQYNPMKEVMDMCDSVAAMPPMLGIFNDIPGHKLREDEVNSWAKAGFTWVVNDGEHQIYEGRYGFEQNMMELRNGILPVQRMHREAISEHGDAFQKGARATMRPYGTTVEEAEQYYRAVTFPTEGSATKDDRGGYPTRDGARKMAFTPKELREAEAPWTQGWIQFETGEYILSDEKYNQGIRDAVLDIMQRQGRNKACGFIGPFDAVIRDGVNPKMNDGINTLIKEAAKRGIAMGRVVGNGAMEDPKDIEDAMVEAIQNGARLICVHRMTSDLPFYGAQTVAQPFWNACKRCGF